MLILCMLRKPLRQIWTCCAGGVLMIRCLLPRTSASITLQLGRALRLGRYEGQLVEHVSYVKYGSSYTKNSHGVDHDHSKQR